MTVGEILLRMSGNFYYSPSFARGGLAACFTVDVLDIGGPDPDLDIVVEHKNHEDVNFATLGTFSTITAAGLEKLDCTAIKEQLRFRYLVGGTAATNMVRYNMLAPQWRPY